MSGSKTIRLIGFAVVVVLVVATAGIASAGITWAPTAGLRYVNEPRTSNDTGATAANQISGQSYAGNNTVAVSNSGTTNYVHALFETDATGGAVDYNDLPGRTFAYPYFGAMNAYGGNDAPIRNLNATGSPYYWDGDCGVMRPHLYTDDFGVYKGGWYVESMAATGAAATMANPGATTYGQVVTLTSTKLADMDVLNVGDRVQLGAGILAADKFAPAGFNRTATGAGSVAANVDPISNAPYWRVASVPAYNQITLTPDVATAQPATATLGGVFTGYNAADPANIVGGEKMFQGAAIGQVIQVTGATPSSWNGYFKISAAVSLRPDQLTVVQMTPGGAALPGVAMTAGNVTRITDNYLTHGISGAAWATGTATYTTTDTNGLVVGQNITVSGMAPAGWNVTGNITAVGATTFSVAMAANPGAVTLWGIGSLNTSTATTMGTLVRGSDCTRVYYTRSSDDGLTWDGGGTSTGRVICTASATCGSTNAFLVSGGATNGGEGKSYISELGSYDSKIQANGAYVYATFVVNGGSMNYPTGVCPNNPKVMYIRVNNNYGAWNAWGPPIRITPSGGQANMPDFTVDQRTGYLYVAATNANTQDLVLYKSTNNGTSWSAGTVVDRSNHQYYSGYVPPDDLSVAIVGDPGSSCLNASRNVGGAGEDSFGYGWTERVAAYNDNVAVAFLKNAAGDRLVTKVSTDGGATWTQSQCPAANCSIHLAKAGAGQLRSGYGAASGGPTYCPYDFGGTTSPNCEDSTGDADFAMVAGPGNASCPATPASCLTRIDYAWVQDGNLGKDLGTDNGWTVIPRSPASVRGPPSPGVRIASSPARRASRADPTPSARPVQRSP
jgi:hypothetical protein